MSYLVLARKYRPTAFDEVVGQDAVVRTLQNAIRMERVAHAYLFTGARGVGKTTVARLLSKALNCEKGPTPEPDVECTICREISRGASPDVFEIDGASNTGVDDVRALRDNLQYLPARSRFKIYIIDEVHMLSTSAFNALLKTLEEPPAHVKFIFATTEPHKIPLTVLSRCQRFDFKRIPSDTIQAHLARVLASESMQIDPDGLRVISRQAAGSLRDSLSLTDQVLAFGGDRITVEQVRQALGLAGSGVYEAVIDALTESRPDDLMRLVEQLFDEGHDLKRFLEGLLWHVHQLILFRSLKNPSELVDLLPEEQERMRAQAERADPLRWHQIFDVLARAAADLGRHPYPRLVLETALLRVSAIEPLVAVDELLARVEHLSQQLGHAGGRSSVGSAGSAGGQPGRRPAPAQARAPSGPARLDRDRKPAGAPARPAAGQPEAPAATPSDAPEPPPPSTGAEGLTGEPAWERLVALILKSRPSLASFLTHARPRRVEPGVVALAFEPGSFFSDQVRAPRNRADLERFCSEFFGQPTQVTFEDLGAKDQVLSLAQSREKEAREVEDSLRRQALEHPMVQEAIRVFGAEVDHIDTKTDRDNG